MAKEKTSETAEQAEKPKILRQKDKVLQLASSTTRRYLREGIDTTLLQKNEDDIARGKIPETVRE